MRKPAVFSTIACLCFALAITAACEQGPKQDGTLAKQEEELAKQAIKDKQVKLVQEVIGTYKASRLHAEKFTDSHYTLEVQQHFESMSGKNIVMEVNMNDIERTTSGIVGVFSAPFGENYLDNFLLLHLTVPSHLLPVFIKGPRHTLYERRNMWILDADDYLIVAKLKEPTSFTFTHYSIKEWEPRKTCDNTQEWGYLVKGELVYATPIPKNNATEPD